MNATAALLRKDAWQARNVRRLLREQSAFKVGFILLFAFFLLASLWAMFLEGFQFLDTLGGVGLMLVSRLFALFFLGLGAMLALSSVATSFTVFFRSEETAFLMLKPLTFGEVATYKALQAAYYSSWAFFFTIIPFVGAYAWHEGLPVFFSFWTLMFSVPFVLLCSGLGSIACLLLVRWLPRGRALVALVLALLPFAFLWLARQFAVTGRPEEDSMLMLTRLIPGLQLASSPLWPSWWVAEGIISFTRDQWGRGAMLWLVLMSNVLLVGMIVEILGRRLFYEAWQRTAYANTRTRRRAVLLRPLERALRFLAGDVRAMVMKDVRAFLRDPAQWVQVVVFFGLLGLYFLNLRTLRYHVLPAPWRNLIAFLNVFSCSAVMCSLGSRFVYPQLSLEGHGFWIIGLSPTTMARVLLAKFALAVAGMTTVSVVLMYLSTTMLAVPGAVKLVAVGIAVGMSLTISGLSVGLGALFMDLKEQNPAAIVSGFGGTLNLVLSLGCMFASIVPFGFAFHLHYTGRLYATGLYRALLIGLVWLAVVTAVSTAVPLLLGHRSLRRREY